MGSVYVAKYATIAMSKNKTDGTTRERGVILFVSSMAATDGPRGGAAYSASKAALAGLVLPMSRDLGRLGIRAVTIAPGYFVTPIEKPYTKDMLKKRL